MLIKLLKQRTSNLFEQVPLKQIIIVPFVLQLFATVGVTGYLSWRNGQQAVMDIANQLSEQATNRVKSNLAKLLQRPHLLSEILIKDTIQGDISFDDIERSENFLWRIIQLFENVYAVYIGNEQGQFIYVSRESDGSFRAKSVEESPNRLYYMITPEGARGDFYNQTIYDPRIRPWYTKTLALNAPNWSPIYAFPNGKLGITASHPLSDSQGQLIGVIGVDFVLTLINDFLGGLEVSPNGEVFIVESSGLLVASSTNFPPYTMDDQNVAQRLHISQVNHPIISGTAAYFSQNFEHLSQIKTSHQSSFYINGEKQFLDVVRYQDKWGLNWLIVVVMPESDFMGRINHNAKITFMLSLVALAITICIGIFMASRVTRPIVNLNKAARKFAQGDWEHTVHISRCQEVGELAESFNQMAAQIRQSFSELEAQNSLSEALNRQLSDREYWLKQFLEALPVGVLVYDKHGKIYYANQKLKKLFRAEHIPEVSLEEFAEINHLYLSSTDQLYPTKALPLVRALKGKTVPIENIEIRHPDQTICCSLMATPIFDSEEDIVYGIGVFEDITQRRQAEIERQNFTKQLKEKNDALKRMDELKDEFLANTSHELRTPLNGMIGLSESMLDGVAGPLTELQRQNLSMIAKSGHRLSTLVNDILDFSKLRHQTLELQLQPLGLREIVEVVVVLSKPLIGNKDIELINEIPDDFPAVNADENRLQQILYNLIGNAIKFTDSGTVKITASVLDTDANNSMAVINISDTGIGILPEKHHRIFESFEQGDGSTARQYGGTGLGLAITKQLVELHQGKIWLDSVVGSGSTFSFTLPISEEIPETTAKADSLLVNEAALVNADVLWDAAIPETENNQSMAGSKLAPDNNQFKIMIVDDDPINLQVLANYLYLENYAVTQATNGMEALKILESGFIPDLILLDVMMPRMTGYEVTEKIREDWPPHQLPIMMLTAKNRISDLVVGLELGANDYLSKPLNKEELLARIKTHIRIKKLRTEKAHIRKTFGRYVTDEVVANLLESHERLQLGGERRTITILTSDLRGFTATSERLNPEEVVKILNFYLSTMADIITHYNGTIDEFMGDGILVLFGAPNVREDDPQRAIACAVAMQLAMESINQTMKAWGYANLEMGIGVHTGEVVVGNIGSEKRTKYGVVGKNVNLTYRIESYTTGGQILISESTLEAVGRMARITGEKQVQPKGVQKPITIYELGGVGVPYNLYLKREKELFVVLPEPISLQYTVLEGKHVGENVFSGTIVELSAREAKVQAESEDEAYLPLPMTNIKLNFSSDMCGSGAEDVYAKVLEYPAEPGHFYIHFTAKSPELEAKLTAIYQGLS
ncbi:MAG: adenylate/guanylate cyclase domain-containing protein [Limnospira sp. PMC 1291.21]|uniref:ATP-binding protein n=1 Tax=unclassified Limnospira TaxID=2642885 RepID=UPI0028E1503F|nr:MULTISPECIES: adenylate/guanylate cyclase domain-containing protein [unclassified Limnospira]MDT9176269.1 adenylate/guanylate cyclase domain-containing protein [Limnospira sp. PMC 1238.20]MDT9191591.1 adenylate/guanylate cyclase domain-containing protein [Limnospira sp. PMC 1245.20]MDT9201943.1 adenylate/guanylate cyclase domain-containing protein [Limnospira sp. PMC 1243.20]MDT9207015.1 adenylate/guanylate cyclase domain-containing protein [Limnospira sp. PMC 1252.20]MDT9212082.1 adenylate